MNDNNARMISTVAIYDRLTHSERFQPFASTLRTDERAAARSAVGPAQPPGLLPISSTPLPFHRNLTVVDRPMPLGYVNAIVSPVVCAASMPLKP